MHFRCREKFKDDRIVVTKTSLVPCSNWEAFGSELGSFRLYDLRGTGIEVTVYPLALHYSKALWNFRKEVPTTTETLGKTITGLHGVLSVK